MKEFVNTMRNDFKKEKFTRSEYLIYGICLPLALFGLMVLAGLIEQITL